MLTGRCVGATLEVGLLRAQFTSFANRHHDGDVTVTVPTRRHRGDARPHAGGHRLAMELRTPLVSMAQLSGPWDHYHGRPTLVPAPHEVPRSDSLSQATATDKQVPVRSLRDVSVGVVVYRHRLLHQLLHSHRVDKLQRCCSLPRLLCLAPPAQCGSTYVSGALAAGAAPDASPRT